MLLLALAGSAVAWGLRAAGPAGLTGRYWNTVDWSGPPAIEARGSMPTAVDFVQRREAPQARPGSAEWTGWLIVDRGGEHQFDLVSDDGAWLYVNESLVVDNGGEHGPIHATGRVALAAGAHALRIRYFQAGAGVALGVWWRPPGAGSAGPLRPTDVAPSQDAARRRRWALLARPAAVAVPVLWAALFLYLPVRLAGAWAWREVMRAGPSRGERRALALLLLCAIAIVAWRIDWGIAGDEWAPDELSPGLVQGALDARLSGGWYDKYPVLHYAVLALPVSAFALADRLEVLPIFSADAHAAQLLVMRAVSVLYGLGTLVAVCLCGAGMAGFRHGIAGAAVLLLTPLFVYYGKTANLDVPSLCWFAWALVAIVRIVTRSERRDYVLLGVAAAGAVATKDQTYASLALLPVVPLVALVRDRRGEGWPRRLGSALMDPRLLAGTAAGVLAFAAFSNLLFNFSGFVEHVRVLYTFPNLAMVPRTLEGYAHLTARTVALIRLSLGWPFFLLAVAGLAAAVVRTERRWWLWLLLVPLSSHLTFTCVALYVNDRYLFAGILVLALFAGATLVDLWGADRARGLARTLAGASIVWSLLSAASVNAMMTRDARNAARAWVTGRSGPETAVGTIGSYVPAFPRHVRALRIDSIDDIAAARPRFIVVNARLAGTLAVAGPFRWQRAIEGLADGSLGYREAFRYRSPLPWWAVLQYEAPFAANAASDLTNLDKINPETVVYERAGE